MLAVLSFSSAYVLPAGAPARSTAAVARAAPSTMDETILQRALEGTLEEEGAEQHWLSEVGWADWQDKNGGASYNMNQRFSKADDGYVTPDVFSNPIDGAPLGPLRLLLLLRCGRGAAPRRGAVDGRRPPGAAMPATPRRGAAPGPPPPPRARTRRRTASIPPPHPSPRSPPAVVLSWKDSMLGVLADPLEKGFPTITNDKTGARAYPKGLNEAKARTLPPKNKDWQLFKNPDEVNKDKRTSGLPGINIFGAPSSKYDDDFKSNPIAEIFGDITSTISDPIGKLTGKAKK